MGFAFKGVCHSTVEAAQIQFCQSLTGSGLSSTGNLIVSNCSSIAPPNVTFTLKNGNSAQTIETLSIPAFLDCNYDGGVQLSLDYFIVAIGFIAVIAASKAVLNIFRGRTDVA